MPRLLAGLCLLLIPVPALCQGRPAPTPAAGQDTVAVRQAANQFAFDLYGRLRGHTSGNLFFSPFSVSSSLAMTSAGARGDTLEQMRRVLRLPAQEKLHPALGRLLRDIAHDDKGCQVQMVNALWVQRGLELEPDFSRAMRTHYPFGLRRVDFAASAEAARREINGWVAQRSRERIRNLLRPGAVDAETTLVLTSALYFKGDWAAPFPKAKSREGTFHVTDQKAVRVPFLRQTGTFGHGESGGVRMLELPYAGGAVSMLVLLPRRADGLAEMEKGLTPERLEACQRALRPTNVDVALPRFRLAVEVHLKPVLLAMGMSQAFGKSADFSGIEKGKRVQLGAVVHKATVELTEHGTEATAATATTVRPKSAASTVVFRADRPFVFLIRDNCTGCVLFLGRLAQPRG